MEDADQLRDLTRRLLEGAGHTVIAAANAHEAQAAFARAPSIDLVLTDVVMPGGSGPELVRELRTRRPSLKAIYMSGYTDEAVLQYRIREPGIVFLQKPFTSDSLIGKIRDVLAVEE